MKNKKIENVTIISKDSYGNCFDDSIIKKDKNLRERPAGYVEIYDGNKQLIGKSNLVVYSGREVVAARMLNVQNPEITSTPDEFISWFGVGSGGCPVGDPLNPIAPANTDIDLAIPVGINESDVECADFKDGYYYKHPIESVEFEQDGENNDAYLIAKITVTLSIYDANGNNLSEAALYTSSNTDGGYDGNFTLYARITFPTIVKASTRQLTFVWYVFY